MQYTLLSMNCACQCDFVGGCAHLGSKKFIVYLAAIKALFFSKQQKQETQIKSMFRIVIVFVLKIQKQVNTS